MDPELQLTTLIAAFCDEIEDVTVLGVVVVTTVAPVVDVAGASLTGNVESPVAEVLGPASFVAIAEPVAVVVLG